MKYKIVMDVFERIMTSEEDSYNRIGAGELTAFDDQEEANSFVNQLNIDISAYLNELDVNHGWHDWQIEQFQEQHLGKYEFKRQILEILDPYDKRQKAYVIEVE